MLVKELKEDNILPYRFTSILPVKCKGLLDVEGNTLAECNHYIGINEALTRLYCTNPVCPSKVAVDVFDLCYKLGLGDIVDIDIAKDFVAYWGITCALQIFMYEISDGKFSKYLSDEECLKVYNTINNRKTMKIKDYFSMSYITSFRNNIVEKLFSSVRTVDELYKNLDIEGFSYIHKVFSESNSHSSYNKEYAMEIYDAIVNGNISKIEELATKIDEKDTLTLIKRVIDEGVEFILKRLEEHERPQSNVIFLLELQIYKDLIAHRENLIECVNYVDIS